MFEKVPSNPDLIAGEHSVLKFWEEISAFEKLRRKSAGKPKWSFLDGPITANNPMGVHHAWGRSYKDCYQRYFAMNGHDLRWQNGFDCQGLWVEVEVERELGFKSKRDIEAYGIAKFVDQCKARVDRFARRQTEQSIRLGYWMDWDREEDWLKPADARRSYFTMSEENNYTIWAFLKRCHDRGLIYKGYDSMPWCPRCGVGISQMEMHEGYVRVAHRAVFVKFPLRDRSRENLLVWTTTPWTLTSNVGAAVNPELKYVKLKHQEEIFYLAKDALEFPRLADEFKRKEWIDGVPKLKTLAQLFKEKGGYEVLEEVSGQSLVGLTYSGPFDDVEAQQSAGGYPQALSEVVIKQQWSPEKSAMESHRVIPWDQVTTSEGTGIVHIAPGCGREDFELGKEHGLPPIAPLDEQGCFLDGFSALSGCAAGETETIDAILDRLRGEGLLFAVEAYPHTYPHCWRCKTELLFRLVDEWYISMSWRDEIKTLCKDIQWIPSFGFDRELDWLSNMGDWMISKKRYWGLALPIWECDSCGHFEVMGSKEEMEQRTVDGWDRFEGHSPHRPYIDELEIKCSQCNSNVRRIPDVGNPWLDAGIVPFSTLKYNHDREYWDQWFPADFVTECFPGQFRNWFYALLAMSAMMEKQAPFKTLLGHALVRDEKGEEMHKSKGNAIWFDDAAEQMGVDPMRWVFCRQNPTSNLNFGESVVKQVERKVFGTLWNTYAFFVNYAIADQFDPEKHAVAFNDRPEIDRWILARLHALIDSAHQSMKGFNCQSMVRDAEVFIDELSNWYVRRNRRRFWRSRNEDDRDKWAAYQTLLEVLVSLCKLMAPVIPFLSERIYQNLVRSWDETSEESVHLCSYPEVNPECINEALSHRMQLAQRAVNVGHALREQAGHRVRQPLLELRVAGDQMTIDAISTLERVICDELNVKQLVFVESLRDLVSVSVKPNFARLGPRFGKELKGIAQSLTELTADSVDAIKENGCLEVTVDGKVIRLEGEDLQIDTVAASDWLCADDQELQLALATSLTPELVAEGWVRDIVRHVQQLRKEGGFEIQDHIDLHYRTDSPELHQAFKQWKSYIQAETLADTISETESEKEYVVGKEVTVGDMDLKLDIHSVPRPDKNSVSGN